MEYLTTKEAAQRLGLTRTRVLEFLNENRLNGKKYGNTWVVLADDVERFARLERKPGWKPGRSRKEQ